MKIFLSGVSGFLGRNLAEFLSTKDNIELFAPPHAALELTDMGRLMDVFTDYTPEVIIHAAGSDEINQNDNWAAFINLATLRYKARFIYFGSGAEGRDDAYGYVKAKMNHYAHKVKNVHNLRLFGCYGAYENPQRRFISRCINAKFDKQCVPIYDDIAFDYVFVKDVVKIVYALMHDEIEHPAYDICTNRQVKLSEIAEIVGCEYEILNDSNNRYGGDNTLLKSVLPFEFTPLEQGINYLETYYANVRANQTPRV